MIRKQKKSIIVTMFIIMALSFSALISNSVFANRKQTQVFAAAENVEEQTKYIETEPLAIKWGSSSNEFEVKATSITPDSGEDKVDAVNPWEKNGTGVTEITGIQGGTTLTLTLSGLTIGSDTYVAQPRLGYRLTGYNIYVGSNRSDAQSSGVAFTVGNETFTKTTEELDPEYKGYILIKAVCTENVYSMKLYNSYKFCGEMLFEKAPPRTPS